MKAYYSIKKSNIQVKYGKLFINIKSHMKIARRSSQVQSISLSKLFIIEIYC